MRRWMRWTVPLMLLALLSAPAGAAGGVAPEGPQRLVDGSLFVPKVLQHQWGLRTAPARTRELAATVTLNGKVLPSPDAGGRVQATLAGTVVPGPKGMPTPGRPVRQGEVLAYLKPAGGAIERGNQQAQLAELDAQLALAASRMRRMEQLEGAVPQKEIEAARINHAALQQRRAFVSASVNTAETLVAPVSGVISASHVVAGQVVELKETLFEIIDPARLNVEALAYDAALAGALSGASALADGAGDGATLALSFVGGGRQLREQALPLLFRITTPNPPVAVGQSVKVLVRTRQAVSGMPVPRAALTQASTGEPAVWVHAEAERFVLRRVRVQALDAQTLAITDGLHEGDRVVTDGVSLLAQVR